MKTILVLTDFSENSKVAAEIAVKLADRIKAEVMLFNAYVTVPAVSTADALPWPQAYYDGIKLESNTKLEKEFNRLQKIFSSHNYTYNQTALNYLNADGTLAENVQAILKEKNVSMIIMGARDKKNGGVLFGSDINEVLGKVNCPVLIVPKKMAKLEIKNVVFATDLALDDVDSLKWVLKLTKHFNFHIYVTHVVKPEILVADFNEQDRVADFTHNIAQLDINKISYKNLEGNHIVRELEKFTEKIHADVLAVVHKKHSLFWRLFHETPTKDLIKHQHKLLLVLPEHWKNNDISKAMKNKTVQTKRQRLPLL